MINSNLTTLASRSTNYKFDNSYSSFSKTTDNKDTGVIDKKDTISITLKTEESSYRDLRVSELKKQIKNGEYKIDTKLTSSAILEDLKLLK